MTVEIINTSIDRSKQEVVFRPTSALEYGFHKACLFTYMTYVTSGLSISTFFLSVHRRSRPCLTVARVLRYHQQFTRNEQQEINQNYLTLHLHVMRLCRIMYTMYENGHKTEQFVQNLLSVPNYVYLFPCLERRIQSVQIYHQLLTQGPHLKKLSLLLIPHVEPAYY